VPERACKAGGPRLQVHIRATLVVRHMPSFINLTVGAGVGAKHWRKAKTVGSVLTRAVCTSRPSVTLTRRQEVKRMRTSDD
jgi:hypothetical protein